MNCLTNNLKVSLRYSNVGIEYPLLRKKYICFDDPISLQPVGRENSYICGKVPLNASCRTKWCHFTQEDIVSNTFVGFFRATVAAFTLQFLAKWTQHFQNCDLQVFTLNIMKSKTVNLFPQDCPLRKKEVLNFLSFGAAIWSELVTWPLFSTWWRVNVKKRKTISRKHQSFFVLSLSSIASFSCDF